MKEINIARTLSRKRKERGVGQEELARYIGVSKASVSKWETGQSYPDITFLPLLAAYFDISIDELMDYEPQMTKEDIRKLYQRLSSGFATRPYDEVIEECRGYIKKYYSCYPLLFQMGALMVNYSPVAGDSGKTAKALEEAKALFVRVREESNEVELAKQSLNMEALCLLSLGRPDEVLSLMGDAEPSVTSAETLLASAYQMTGKQAKAKSIMQVGIYQYLVGLIGDLSSYLPLCTDDPAQFEETCRRVFALADAFHLGTLHPSLLMSFYIIAAQSYAAAGENEKTLIILQKYCALATGVTYPLELHGDGYFNLIEDWLGTLVLGALPPRDDETIRKSIVDAVEQNPAFSALEGNPDFMKMLESLKMNLTRKDSIT